MHSVSFSKTGGPEVLEYKELKLEDPKSGEVLIKHSAIGLNFIDTYHRSGLYPVPLPSGIGLEGAGTIEKAGPDVSNFKEGDKVAYAAAPLGSYSSHRIYPTKNLVKVPEGIDLNIVACLMTKGLTTFYLLHKTYEVKKGQTILFHAAAGGVGQIFCQWAKSLGCKVIGTVGSDEKIDLAKLLYPPMQAADIHSLDLDIVHAGMDQRKIHMLVREIFPKMKWKVPVAVHHSLLPGLTQPKGDSTTEPGKMSKSDPNSGIFIHNSDDEIKKKINKGWCEEGLVENNPVLEIARQIVFHEYDSISIERPEKFGGNVTYNSYEELEADFAQKNLHPGDLKNTVGEHMVKIIAPIRDKISLSNELFELIKNSH